MTIRSSHEVRTNEYNKQSIKSRLIRYELKCSNEADEEADDKANTDIDAKADHKVFATRSVFRGHDRFLKMYEWIALLSTDNS